MRRLVSARCLPSAAPVLSPPAACCMVELDATRCATRNSSSRESTDERLARVARAIGGGVAEEIERRTGKGDFFHQLDKKTDTQWLSTQHHYRKQDQLAAELGVEGAIRETISSSKVSFNQQLRARQLDKTILTECYKQVHGKRVERHLKKGWEWEHFVTRDSGNAPVREAHARGRALFGVGDGVTLVKKAATVADFPVSKLPEIAFVGRTNSGKSSLVNAMLNNLVAPWGHLPGTTCTANFYRVGSGLMVVDLPGYGFYNQVQSSEAEAITAVATMRQYLRCGGRHEHATRNIKRVALCVSPMGLFAEDIKYLKFLDTIGCPIMVVVCKTDLVPVKELARRVDVMRCELAHFTNVKELMLTSGLRLAGIAQLQDRVAEMALRKADSDELDEAAIANLVG